jgi:hypothetical protein
LKKAALGQPFLYYSQPSDTESKISLAVKAIIKKREKDADSNL